MKIIGIILIFAVLLLAACGESEEDIYALLMEVKTSPE